MTAATERRVRARRGGEVTDADVLDLGTLEADFAFEAEQAEIIAGNAVDVVTVAKVDADQIVDRRRSSSGRVGIKIEVVGAQIAALDADISTVIAG